MRRLKNRKGIFIILFGLLFMVLMAVSAMAVDMSRIWTMRNELQTSADAGALAGAIQLTPPHQPAGNRMIDTATWAARANFALYDTVHVDSVNHGVWDDAAGTFTAGGSLNNATAVEVVVSHGTNKLIIGALGIAAPRVKARAVAWANAPVDNTNCMKPWSMPYTVLMDLVNRARIAAGNWPYADTDPDSFGNLTREFTDDDRQFLANNMSDAQRTFTLKMASGQTFNEGIPGSTMPGNFQAIQLPRHWSADGTEWPDGNPRGTGGADSYRDAIEGVQCYPLGVGDRLDVFPGDVVGPTLQAVEKQNPGDQNYICASIASNGDCMNDGGTAGVDIKTAFHQCLTGCQGATEVTVRMIGSFTLTKMYKTPGNAQQGENWDMGQIVGIFKPLASTGPVGTGSTTIRKIILVR
jgi:putative Flp pilus-assembly TadE/G-like protein